VPLRLAGHFRVRTSNPAASSIEAVTARLVSLLEVEKAGAITRSGTTITWRRGYGLERFSRERLNLFDPGEIRVGAKGHTIRVEYRLGVTSPYVQIGVPAAIVVVGFLIDHFGSLSLVVNGLLIFGLVSGMLAKQFRVHRWLRSAAISAVPDAL
jgi:hypothetical protein